MKLTTISCLAVTMLSVTGCQGVGPSGSAPDNNQAVDNRATVGPVIAPAPSAPESAQTDAGELPAASNEAPIGPVFFSAPPSDFGVVSAGSSMTRVFQVRNDTDREVRVSSVVVSTGSEPGGFSLAGNSCEGVLLPPAESCSVSVVLAAQENGDYTGELHVDVVSGGSVLIPLESEGHAPVQGDPITAPPTDIGENQ